jgi:hypothetical protein
MVKTAPLAGLFGVMNKEVFVDEAALATGPAVNKARTAASIGTNLPRYDVLEVVRLLSGTMGDCVMVVKAPI